MKMDSSGWQHVGPHSEVVVGAGYEQYAPVPCIFGTSVMKKLLSSGAPHHHTVVMSHIHTEQESINNNLKVGSARAQHGNCVLSLDSHQSIT
jgi:hypothetical protein